MNRKEQKRLTVFNQTERQKLSLENDNLIGIARATDVKNIGR